MSVGARGPRMLLAGPAVRLPLGPRLGSSDGLVAATVLLCALAAAAGAVGAVAPEALRLLFFVVLVTALTALSFFSPRAGALATMAYLVVMALIRRLLLPASPWSSFDPLLLVGPVIACVLLIRLFVLERRAAAPDLLSKLVLAVLALTVLQIVNPAGGGVAGGLAGFFFVGMPLLWFFIGRELADDAFLRGLLAVVLFGGLLAGLYGIYQLAFGFPSWDYAWTQIALTNGLNSLDISGTTRAFGTFSSFLEYALVLATALVAAVAFLLQGRVQAILAVPPLFLALFLSSSRGPLITSVLAVIVMLALRPRRPVLAVVIIVVALGGAVGALKVLGTGGGGGSTLVNHQVQGLANPLDKKDSTLLVHVSLVVDGVKASLHHPLGSGTSATNQAGSKLGGGESGVAPTEVDVSNAFVNLGILGGVLYLLVVLTALLQALRGYMAGHELLLPALGVLVVGLGQWLSGGHWFLSPATWLFVGWVAAAARCPAPTVDPPPAPATSPAAP